MRIGCRGDYSKSILFDGHIIRPYYYSTGILFDLFTARPVYHSTDLLFDRYIIRSDDYSTILLFDLFNIRPAYLPHFPLAILSECAMTCITQPKRTDQWPTSPLSTPPTPLKDGMHTQATSAPATLRPGLTYDGPMEPSNAICLQSVGIGGRMTTAYLRRSLPGGRLKPRPRLNRSHSVTIDFNPRGDAMKYAFKRERATGYYVLLVEMTRREMAEANADGASRYYYEPAPAGKAHQWVRARRPHETGLWLDGATVRR